LTKTLTKRLIGPISNTEFQSKSAHYFFSNPAHRMTESQPPPVTWRR